VLHQSHNSKPSVRGQNIVVVWLRIESHKLSQTFRGKLTNTRRSHATFYLSILACDDSRAFATLFFTTLASILFALLAGNVNAEYHQDFFRRPSDWKNLEEESFFL